MVSSLASAARQVAVEVAVLAIRRCLLDEQKDSGFGFLSVLE